MGSFWKTNPFGGVLPQTTAASRPTRLWWGFGCRDNYFAASRRTRFGKRTHLEGCFKGLLAFGMVFLYPVWGLYSGCAIWKTAASGDAAYSGDGRSEEVLRLRARVCARAGVGGPFGLAQGRRRPPLQEPAILGRLGLERFGLQYGGRNGRRYDAFKATDCGCGLDFWGKRTKPWSRQSS